MQLLKDRYGLDVRHAQHASAGAGSDTWFITCADGKYVVKFPSAGAIDHPEQEPALCRFLLDAGIPACRFVPDREGHLLSTDDAGRLFHVQTFIEGTTYAPNTAPDWLLTDAAALLGRIHTVLRGFPGLPTGIGADFFRHMTPERAMASYRHTLSIAPAAMQEDLRWRIGLMQRMPPLPFDLADLTCTATHGDYTVSQLICRDGHIAGVVDWTCACVHPVVWEILRSYVYAAPSCRDGVIDIPGLRKYVEAYRSCAPLTEADLRAMAPLLFRQLAVCDYYGQYLASREANRHIFLHQAEFSTRLLRWLEQHADELTRALLT